MSGLCTYSGDEKINFQASVNSGLFCVYLLNKQFLLRKVEDEGIDVNKMKLLLLQKLLLICFYLI